MQTDNEQPYIKETHDYELQVRQRIDSESTRPFTNVRSQAKHGSEISYSNPVPTPKKTKLQLAKPLIGNSGDQERMDTEMTELETVLETSFLPPTSEENYPQTNQKRTPL